MSDIAVSSCCMIHSSSDLFFFRKRKFLQFPIDVCLNLCFNFCLQLVSHTVDHFNSIVIKWIVTCRNHNSTIKIFRSRHIRDTWCRCHMKKIDIRPGCCQPCNERILKHITATSCILPDHNLRLMILSIIPSKKSSDFKCMFYCQNLICLTTKSVCSKIFSHVSSPLLQVCSIIRFFCTICFLFFYII